jgi:hypothetical protein
LSGPTRKQSLKSPKKINIVSICVLNIILLLLTTLKTNAYALFDDGDYSDLKLI